MTARTALVVVPTYNELANLPVLVAGLMEQPNVGLLVVDDQSPDGTGALADQLVLHVLDGRFVLRALIGLRLRLGRLAILETRPG